jgi:hypothetical protein
MDNPKKCNIPVGILHFNARKKGERRDLNSLMVTPQSDPLDLEPVSKKGFCGVYLNLHLMLNHTFDQLQLPYDLVDQG